MPRPRILVVDDHPEVVDCFLELREDPRTRDMKVILMSGYTQVGEFAREYGAQDYLEYPVKYEDMGAKVDKVLAA